MEDPVHQLIAQQAAIFRAGGYGLDRDLQKAGKYTEIYVCVCIFAGGWVYGQMVKRFVTSLVHVDHLTYPLKSWVLPDGVGAHFFP